MRWYSDSEPCRRNAPTCRRRFQFSAMGIQCSAWAFWPESAALQRFGTGDPEFFERLVGGGIVSETAHSASRENRRDGHQPQDPFGDDQIEPACGLRTRGGAGQPILDHPPAVEQLQPQPQGDQRSHEGKARHFVELASRRSLWAMYAG